MLFKKVVKLLNKTPPIKKNVYGKDKRHKTKYFKNCQKPDRIRILEWLANELWKIKLTFVIFFATPLKNPHYPALFFNSTVYMCVTNLPLGNHFKIIYSQLNNSSEE